MSDINGKGYGDKHDWERYGTVPCGGRYNRVTLFKCNKCHQTFSHYHNLEPDIFDEMRKSNITEECEIK